MEKQLVSICLLTYNHEKYVLDALKGFVAQEYQNIELITLDDASTDNTVQVIRTMMPVLNERFVRVVQMQNETNSGNISQNCNRMMAEARGAFIHVISGDDVMLPHCERTLVGHLEENPDCNMAYGNMIWVPDGYGFGKTIDAFYVWRPQEEPSRKMKEGVFETMMDGCFVSAPTAMIRASVLETHGYHDESIPIEDYEYWLRLSVDSAFYYESRPLVLYRRGTESYTNTQSPKRKERILSMIRCDYAAKKKYLHLLDKETQKKCIINIVRIYASHCADTGFKEGLNELYDIMEAEGISIDEIE